MVRRKTPQGHNHRGRLKKWRVAVAKTKPLAPHERKLMCNTKNCDRTEYTTEIAPYRGGTPPWSTRVCIKCGAKKFVLYRKPHAYKVTVEEKLLRLPEALAPEGRKCREFLVKEGKSMEWLGWYIAKRLKIKQPPRRALAFGLYFGQLPFEWARVVATLMTGFGYSPAQLWPSVGNGQNRTTPYRHDYWSWYNKKFKGIDTTYLGRKKKGRNGKNNR